MASFWKTHVEKKVVRTIKQALFNSISFDNISLPARYNDPNQSSDLFLAVQDSSIGDLVTDSLTE